MEGTIIFCQYVKASMCNFQKILVIMTLQSVYVWLRLHLHQCWLVLHNIGAVGELKRGKARIAHKHYIL